MKEVEIKLGKDCCGNTDIHVVNEKGEIISAISINRHFGNVLIMQAPCTTTYIGNKSIKRWQGASEFQYITVE